MILPEEMKKKAVTQSAQASKYFLLYSIFPIIYAIPMFLVKISTCVKNTVFAEDGKDSLFRISTFS